MASATAQPEMLHRGGRLGLPESGSGAMAGTGRRTVALLLDWFTAMIISGALIADPASLSRPFLTLGIFAAQVWLFTWLWGASFGQRFMRLRVRALQGRLSIMGAGVRTLLICLVIPPAVWDADGRGMHDRAAGTVVVRA